MVMRIEPSNSSQKSKLIYHLNCFKCLVCNKPLRKGEEYFLRSEGIYCKYDYEQSNVLSYQQMHNENRLGNGSKTPNYQVISPEYGTSNLIIAGQGIINNQNSSFSSSPVSSSSSVSSTSSISSLSSTSIYSNPGSLMMHQQLESLQPHGHNLLLQNTNASNLFNHNQFNKQIGMNNIITKINNNP